MHCIHCTRESCVRITDFLPAASPFYTLMHYALSIDCERSQEVYTYYALMVKYLGEASPVENLFYQAIVQLVCPTISWLPLQQMGQQWQLPKITIAPFQFTVPTGNSTRQTHQRLLSWFVTSKRTLWCGRASLDREASNYSYHCLLICWPAR